MAIFWVNHTMRSGVQPWTLRFNCARCNAECMSSVHAGGVASGSQLYGVLGPTVNETRTRAEENAETAARAYLAFAACPSCARFSEALVSRLASAVKENAARLARRWKLARLCPAPLLLGGVLALVVWSPFFAVAGAATSLALFCTVVYALTPEHNAITLTHPPNVMFYWNDAWVRPEVSYTSTFAETTPRRFPIRTYWGGLAFLFAALGCAFVALIAGAIACVSLR